jgi:apolipoprotein N-acyltransferase
LTLPRPGLSVLAWIGLIPLLRAPSAGAGFAAGLGYHATAFWWIYSTCRFAGLPAPVALLAWSGLAGLLALNWALAGWLLKRLPPQPWLQAAAWTAVAFASERFTPRLPGDLLEYTQWNVLPLVQLAAYGPHVLGFLIVLVNSALAHKRQRLLAAGLVFLSLLHGVWRMSPHDSPAVGWVGLLQPNVDQYEKWDEGRAALIEANLAELSTRARAPLVIWPETSLPYYVESAVKLPGRSTSTHIVGVLSREGEEIRNSAYLIRPDGSLGGAYHKRQLVPFGEFMPVPYLDRFIPILTQMGAISPGVAEQPFFDTPLGAAAVGICYEAAFPRWARRDAARGARLLVNITNDGWYKDTWGPLQHFQLNAFRAVETGLPVVRAANTGISGVIGPSGDVLSRMELGTRGASVSPVPAPLPPTPYVRFGDVGGWLCLLILCAWFIRRATS